MTGSLFTLVLPPCAATFSKVEEAVYPLESEITCFLLSVKALETLATLKTCNSASRAEDRLDVSNLFIRPIGK
jgi:hypothetical protein